MTFQVKRPTFNYDTIPPVETSTVINVGMLAFTYAKGGGLKKDDKGQIITNLINGYTTDTADIAIGDRIYSGTSIDYLEVLNINRYCGHTFLDLKEVKGR